MNVIFEGALSRSWRMQDVLKAVMGVENQSYGILRLASRPANIEGRLAVANGQFIIGATIAGTPESGYPAVCKLLSLAEGNFAFLDAGQVRPQEFNDDTLYISLAKVISSLPSLPQAPAELFDEKALLDKIFGAGAFVSEPKSATPANGLPLFQGLVEPTQPKAEPKPELRSPIANWQMVEPLLEDDSQSASDERKISAGREGVTRMRGEEPPWHKALARDALSICKEPLAWLIIVVGIIVGISYWIHIVVKR